MRSSTLSKLVRRHVCHAEGRGFESLHPLLLSQTALQIRDFDSCECREPRAATFCLHLESQARLVGWPANGRSYRITLRNKPATRSARLTVVSVHEFCLALSHWRVSRSTYGSEAFVRSRCGNQLKRFSRSYSIHARFTSLDLCLERLRFADV